jgi:hypothetical protein
MANPTNQMGNKGGPASDAGKTMDKAKDAAGGVMDKAKDMASDAAHKASDMAHNVADKARDYASQAGHKAENLTGKVGSGVESIGGSIRDHLPHEGTMGAVADRVADNVESAGRYLQEEGLSGMADDVTDLVRRNPIPALLVGIGLGYLIARATRS